MKKLIFILFLFMGTVGFAQTSPGLTSKTATTAKTAEELIKTSKPTDLKFEGQTVYQTSKGSYIIVVQSKKTGSYYKKYLQKDK